MRVVDIFKQGWARLTAKRHPDYEPAVGELSEKIVSWIQDTGLSPCHGARLVQGPRGGASQNFWCEACHARYNVVVDFPVPWGECTMVKDDEGFRLLAREYDPGYGGDATLTSVGADPD